MFQDNVFPVHLQFKPTVLVNVEVNMKSVIKGTGYVLVHTPDMVIENGATQTT